MLIHTKSTSDQFKEMHNILTKKMNSTTTNNSFKLNNLIFSLNKDIIIKKSKILHKIN